MKRSQDQVYELCNLNYCNQNIRTKVHKDDPTRFPNICLSKKKAQDNFCSFRFKVSVQKVFHQHNSTNINQSEEVLSDPNWYYPIIIDHNFCFLT